MVTRDYGARWVSLGHEVKGVARPAKSASVKDVMAALRTKVGLYPVEIINLEGIAAGEVLVTREPVLVHTKHDAAAGAVAVTVRSANRTLSDNVLKDVLSAV